MLVLPRCEWERRDRRRSAEWGNSEWDSILPSSPTHCENLASINFCILACARALHVCVLLYAPHARLRLPARVSYTIFVPCFVRSLDTLLLLSFLRSLGSCMFVSHYRRSFGVGEAHNIERRTERASIRTRIE